MLAHWNNSPQVDILLYSDTLFWFWVNQSLLLLFSAACLVEKQQISICSLEPTIYHTQDKHANHYTTDTAWFSLMWYNITYGQSVAAGIIRPVFSALAPTHGLIHVFYKNVQFPSHVNIIKTKILLPQAHVTLVDFGSPVKVLWCSSFQRLFKLFVLKYFGFEHTWWRSFQKHIVWTKFNIYDFITITGLKPADGLLVPEG